VKPSLSQTNDRHHLRLATQSYLVICQRGLRPVRAAEAIFSQAAKAIEIEDIEARVANLERSAELSKQR
jgi:hypothetical protein